MSRGSHDRVGLTWHPALAASILSHGHRLDIVEVIPEGTFLDSRKARRALRTLSRQIPVAIHGVSLGFASAAGVEARRLEAFARLVDEIEPEHWSDHLAFVRAGGVELGHLAAPSRTALTVEATAENLDRATRLVGRIPLVENVASLIDPPASDRTEEAWLHDLLDASACDLLLDLHNLVTNGRNFGYDPAALVEGLPAHRIRAVHIAGGSELEAATGDRRVLDDHRHDVPDSVYRLLELVAARVPHPIDVILERDGAFPPFEQLLGELDRARAALATGRAMRRAAADAVAAAAPARRRRRRSPWSDAARKQVRPRATALPAMRTQVWSACWRGSSPTRRFVRSSSRTRWVRGAGPALMAPLSPRWSASIVRGSSWHRSASHGSAPRGVAAETAGCCAPRVTSFNTAAPLAARRRVSHHFTPGSRPMARRELTPERRVLGGRKVN